MLFSYSIHLLFLHQLFLFLENFIGKNMFLERTRKGEHKTGWIEVIAGSMFSGKTEELIRRLRRAEFAKLKVEIFKPSIDVRYSEEDVVSHNANAIRSTPVSSSSNILLLATDVDVVGIDEAQFFDNGIVDVCTTLANKRHLHALRRTCTVQLPQVAKQRCSAARRKGHLRATVP